MFVDDHAIVLEGYRRLIEKIPDIEVVAEAMDGHTAFQTYKAVRPDVVTVDISMPGRGGIDLIRCLRLWDPNARIVVFTMHRNASVAVHAFHAGARGYVTKSSKPMLLIEAIRAASLGGKFISPDISEDLALERVDGERSIFQSLSTREFEVLQQLLDARSHDAIASALSLSPKTIANYHYAIKQKLGVESDIELAYLCLREKLTFPTTSKLD
ncbi:LuxR family transcriptional regulator [Hyphomicrobium denitrificans 1NES1]|uniref:LuxR family transcriptional regulator n=2 Tax=Hyphomicrobium denitrificans TaxID=53399 RepID=N0B8P9_9HYPH|nr:LuxR family transcriptional regulator [Hyphomicrobium denitrificans 1NES1]